ncbi:hypothetical protein FKM82_028214 [Ascaphus truei]
MVLLLQFSGHISFWVEFWVGCHLPYLMGGGAAVAILSKDHRHSKVHITNEEIVILSNPSQSPLEMSISESVPIGILTHLSRCAWELFCAVR